MDKFAAEPNNATFAGLLRHPGPFTVVIFFCLMFLGVCFYNSRKVALWESQEEKGRDIAFSPAVLSWAGTSETLKTKLKLDRFFDAENGTWRAMKESPLVFGQPEASEIVPEETELPSSSENGENGPAVPNKEPVTPDFVMGGQTATDTLTAGTTTVAAATTTSDVASQLRQETVFTAAPPNPGKISGPFRMLIVGDSFVAIGGGMGDPLEKTLLSQKDTIVTRLGKVSSGLARQDYFNWPATAQKMVTQHNPNVAIMMYGANDN
ncbi:MAG: hypothetical protein MUD10_04270, partial [Candidatus Pacebacteria bacterium]|nr:hypothetical protein [Candidatus Paceibacterota bacterium]